MTDNWCKVENITVMFNGKHTSVENLKFHGVELYKYNEKTKRYEITEYGKLCVGNEDGKLHVCGKCNSFEVEMSDIIIHTLKSCETGIRRFDKG